MIEIRIEGLKVYAYHGVYDEEKRDGQKFFLDANLECVVRAGDDLAGTANYGEVALFLKKFAAESRFDLIESLAAHAAEGILDRFDTVRAARVTVHKPHAPIPAEFRDVSVSVKREWTPCCLSLGSNMGDKRAYLDGAVAGLERSVGVRVLAKSSYHVTPPYGVTDQDEFLNACAKVETYLSPREMLNVCQSLENDAHRVRTRRWGERTLDVDLLLYGDTVLDEPDLIVPHIDMQNRAFVLESLAEIAAGTSHPVFHKTIAALRDELRGANGLMKNRI